MTLKFEISGSQIDGDRDYQEDAFLITNLSDSAGNPSSLIVVADGMGGHAAGNVASNMAVQAFNKNISTNYPSDNISEILNASVLKANASVAETIKETPALDGMGCTIVAAILEKNKLWWASVGDSHLYLLRNKELSKINADHSYGGFLDRMEAAGSPVEPEPGLSRNMLMSAVTGGDIADIDCPENPLELQNGDQLIICSDGLDTLSSGKIIQYSEWSESAKETTEALLNAVEEADKPKQDNTTVVVVNISEGETVTEMPAPEVEAEAVEVDAEDITDPSGKAVSAPEPEPAPEPESEEPETEKIAPAPEPAPAPQPQPAGQKSSKLPLILGIAAGLLVVIIIGGYFVISSFMGKVETVTQEIADEMEIAMEESIQEMEQETRETSEEAVDITTDEEEIPEGAIDETADIEEVIQEETPVEIPEEIQEEQAITSQPEVPDTTTETEIKHPEKGSFQDPLKSGGMGPEMVWIPAGSFKMGSSTASSNADEHPQHTVTLKQFAISKYEITFAEYEKYARAKGRKIPDNLYMEKATHPVIFVSWDDAYNYTKWLSDQTGKNYRLPSESEWEYAASGGSEASFWWGFDEKNNMAHCLGCGTSFDPRKPTKIGTFEPNQFGIHDTAGNVAEWVHDCWHKNYKDAPVDGSVWEGGDCKLRVVRGGSYNSPQHSIRRNKRDKLTSDAGYDIVGIRVVREPD